MSFRLKEFEGKILLKKSKISVPKSKLIRSPKEVKSIKEAVVKAQTLSGKRAKNNGIKICSSNEEIKHYVKNVLGNKIKDEVVEEILIEDQIKILEEHYLSFMFNTKSKSPQMVLSKSGGIDIEEFNKLNPKKVLKRNINPLEGLDTEELSKDLKKLDFKEDLEELKKLILKAYECFEKNDLKLLEINPLAYTKEGYIAIDCMAIIDTEAMKRHEFNFPPRLGLRKPTKLELEAKKIDETDYRGVAGKTFLELDGDIAVLASGGGASMVCMDALLTYNGKPANYTEYSGNPSSEKVQKLTKLTLSKPDLKGCWIVGGTANFTDIEETFKGIINALKEINPKYPIVIRRAGPKDKKAFKLMKEAAEKNNWQVELYNENTPMTLTAKTIVELSDQYRKNGNINR